MLFIDVCRDSLRIDLHLRPSRAIHVVTAAITAKGDHMNTAIEETGTAQAAAEKPKANKKDSVGQKRAHVAPAKGKPAKKAKAPKKAPKAAKKADGARV
jgi:hypothetical protein